MILRTATMTDAHQLLAWRNDPETRANSHRQDVVGPDTHQAWLPEVLADPARTLLIAEEGGVALGTVRLDRDGNEVVLSWTVAPEHRGKGHGTTMVRCAVDKTRGTRLRAEIAPANARSMAIARAAGFRLNSMRNGMTVWVRQP